MDPQKYWSFLGRNHPICGPDRFEPYPLYNTSNTSPKNLQYLKPFPKPRCRLCLQIDHQVAQVGFNQHRHGYFLGGLHWRSNNLGLCQDLYVSLEEYFQVLLDMLDLATFLAVLIVLSAGSTISVLGPASQVKQCSTCDQRGCCTVQRPACLNPNPCALVTKVFSCLSLRLNSCRKSLL